MDIVKLVSQFVTPGALNQIATLLGISQADMQKALGAAVPGILASLLGTAQRPGAADALGAALAKATGEGGLATTLGRDPAAAAAAGSGVLGSLLGGGGAGKLAEALASYTGLSKSAGGSLLGLAGSMALGALGGEAKAKGLDAKGVLGLLESNKDQIAASLPSGFASALAGSGLLGGLGQPAAAPPPRRRRPAAGGDHAAEGRAAAHPADAGPPPRHELALVADRGADRHLAALALPGPGPRAGHRGDRAAACGDDDHGACTRAGGRACARPRARHRARAGGACPRGGGHRAGAGDRPGDRARHPAGDDATGDRAGHPAGDDATGDRAGTRRARQLGRRPPGSGSSRSRDFGAPSGQAINEGYRKS